ncbi:hypothetical protein [Rhizobium sp. LCM 4573]|uniref:hypothetical protein n=1 Tax=Rhizobium sp. LCM 4573 TaxID=1848291 RepID=UPI0008DA9F5E|nr:hypothetical protein [Rhizobium sp. LCM 4573]OHV84180.1 hypothetical protein LCM4573_00270 [Rhizobium sp. LCM 4573]
MKKAFALAVLLSAASIGGAYARDTGTAAMPADDVRIVYTNPEQDDSARILGVPDSFIHPTREMTQAAQSEIRSDRALHAELVGHNVQLNNVVAIDTAANGGKIVYIR